MSSVAVVGVALDRHDAGSPPVVHAAQGATSGGQADRGPGRRDI